MGDCSLFLIGLTGANSSIVAPVFLFSLSLFLFGLIVSNWICFDCVQCECYFVFISPTKSFVSAMSSLKMFVPLVVGHSFLLLLLLLCPGKSKFLKFGFRYQAYYQCISAKRNLIFTYHNLRTLVPNFDFLKNIDK